MVSEQCNPVRTLVLSKNHLTDDELIDHVDTVAEHTDLESLDITSNKEVTQAAIKKILTTITTLKELRTSVKLIDDDISAELKAKLKY